MLKKRSQSPFQSVIRQLLRLPISQKAAGPQRIKSSKGMANESRFVVMVFNGHTA
jgi:hypothetical protein